MFLGPINVRSSSKDIQLKVKEEYNAYRVRQYVLDCFFCFAPVLRAESFGLLGIGGIDSFGIIRVSKFT